jgi:hypothetical protein
MANDNAKRDNMLRLSNLALFGLTAGVWDFVGETAFALSGKIGAEILGLMEKDMGLEIGGEKPLDVVREIGRLFVDEFGIASEIDVQQEGKKITLHVRNCLNVPLTKQLMAAGVEKPFICPIMNASMAALKRMGTKTRYNVDSWAEGNGSIITLDLV